MPDRQTKADVESQIADLTAYAEQFEDIPALRDEMLRRASVLTALLASHRKMREALAALISWDEGAGSDDGRRLDAVVRPPRTADPLDRHAKLPAFIARRLPRIDVSGLRIDNRHRRASPTAPVGVARAKVRSARLPLVIFATFSLKTLL